MSVVQLVGVPSSSIFSEPRRNGRVPSSTIVQTSDATRFPIKFEKADVFFRLKSASSPWPIASCNRIPGHPPAKTTGMTPAGASTADKFRIASRRGFSRVTQVSIILTINSNSTRPPPPKLPTCRLALSSAIQVTCRRDNGWTSPDQRSLRSGDDHDLVLGVKGSHHILNAGIVPPASASISFKSAHTVSRGDLGLCPFDRVQVSGRPALSGHWNGGVSLGGIGNVTGRVGGNLQILFVSSSE